MATTYLADNWSAPAIVCPFEGIEMVREFKYTLTAAFVINDLIKLAPIPASAAGILLTSYFIDLPDLDSGGTPTFTCDLGDLDSAARFVAAATTGQAAGYLTPSGNGVAASLPFKYTAANALVLKVHAAAQTAPTSGVIRGFAKYCNVSPLTSF